MNTKKKRTNSRAKGANGEREAAKFLRQYNLPDGTPVVARRMARNGQKGAADIEHNIPGVHFEVKRREGMDVGTKALEDACHQAARYGVTAQHCLVLWRNNRSRWRISECSIDAVDGGQIEYNMIYTYDAHAYLRTILQLTLAT